MIHAFTFQIVLFIFCNYFTKYISIHLPRATKNILVKYINKKHIAVLGKNKLVSELKLVQDCHNTAGQKSV